MSDDPRAPRPGRRAVLAFGAVIAGLARAAAPGGADAGAAERPKTPRPSPTPSPTPTPTPPRTIPLPSMTTTDGAPAVVAAHAAILAPGSASPVATAPERLQVAVLTTEPCAVRVTAWAQGAKVGYSTPWVPTATGLNPDNPVNVAKAMLPAPAGAPGVAWRWKVALAPTGTLPGAGPAAATVKDPAVRMLPARPAPGEPSAFAVAVGSCSQVAHSGTPHRTLPAAAAIRQAGVAEFVHLGDTSYVDVWTEFDESTATARYSKYASGARQHFTQPDLAALYDGVPMRVVMDDHESGPDGSTASTVFPEARQVFTDSFAGTTFDAAGWHRTAPTSVSYDHWSIGEVDFFLLDNRMWRDGPGEKSGTYRKVKYGSQLGTLQRTWLKRELAASAAPLKVIYSPRSFRHFYDHMEQEELLDFLESSVDGAPTVSGTVLFLTGDMHAAAAWRLSKRREIFEVQCAPLLNNILHPIKPLKSWQVGRGFAALYLYTKGGTPGPALGNAWAKLAVDTTDPDARTATVTLSKDTGEVLYALDVPV